MQARPLRVAGSSNAFGLASGGLFRLDRHPCEAHNALYLCTGTQVLAKADGYGAWAMLGNWQCDFEAPPSTQQYCPVREIEKPFVKGPQTAVVVDPVGEETPA
jgi:type VI secretion system secreted protein VgrG